MTGLTRKDFVALVRAPKERREGAYCTLVVSRLPLQKSTRYACVVSAKSVPRAVDRNRLKRRCRAVLRALRSTLAPCVYVVYLRREARSSSYRELSQDVETLISRARVRT